MEPLSSIETAHAVPEFELENLERAKIYMRSANTETFEDDKVYLKYDARKD